MLRKIPELDARHEVNVIPTPVACEVLAGIVQSKSRIQASLLRGWVSWFQVADLESGGGRAFCIDPGGVVPSREAERDDGRSHCRDRPSGRSFAGHAGP